MTRIIQMTANNLLQPTPNVSYFQSTTMIAGNKSDGTDKKNGINTLPYTNRHRR
jgi:hypothetical protein